MEVDSYEFDPCILDDINEEKETIDNWEPTFPHSKIVPSKWRQLAIGDDFDQKPGLDELKKIHMHLKNNAPDSDIMKAFGITAETLVAIKKYKYDPIDGISLDNQSKIYKEFEFIKRRIESLFSAIKFIANIVCIDKDCKAEFKKSFKKPAKRRPIKKNISEENKNDGDCEEIEQNKEFRDEEE